ncbi:hypothetical protein JZ751_017251 [Albula glossodonta]|uniref:Uncharacterized protein n=1 Tax=Albula glossodonta TaxID=121402 RepID=A0A8T2N1J6_9TELE|nr:hypothetical protein JZ751_017251 [Albula glossodonta]
MSVSKQQEELSAQLPARRLDPDPEPMEVDEEDADDGADEEAMEIGWHTEAQRWEGEVEMDWSLSVVETDMAAERTDGRSTLAPAAQCGGRPSSSSTRHGGLSQLDGAALQVETHSSLCSLKRKCESSKMNCASAKMRAHMHDLDTWPESAAEQD